jgi:hypothetical protein
MAKRRNKAAKIREALAELGSNASAKEVVEALAARRVKVSPAQVYNIKAAAGKSNGRRTSGDTLDALLQAKKLVDSVGGIDKARDALAALAKLL